MQNDTAMLSFNRFTANGKHHAVNASKAKFTAEVLQFMRKIMQTWVAFELTFAVFEIRKFSGQANFGATQVIRSPCLHERNWRVKDN